MWISTVVHNNGAAMFDTLCTWLVYTNSFLSSSSTDGFEPLSALQLNTIFINVLPVWSQKPCMSLLCSCHLTICVSLATLVPDVVGMSLVRITALSTDGAKGKHRDTQVVSAHTKGCWDEWMANVVIALPGDLEHIETIVKSNLVIDWLFAGGSRHSFPVLLWMCVCCGCMVITYKPQDTTYSTQ